MTAFVIYPLLTAALFYLGSRAQITSWLWSRYPTRLAVFMDCPYCTGFWYGLAVSLILQLPLGELAGDQVKTILVVGFCSIVWTPVIAGLTSLMHAQLGSIVDPTQDQEEHGGGTV